MSRDPLIGWLAAATCALALTVVVLGAWVRLSDAGLGCPDWPGCYGHLDVPETRAEIAAANARYGQQPVDTAKAWKEMVHRYVAGALGLMVAAIAAAAWSRRRRGTPARGPTIVLALVVAQAVLGMWTVTLLLKPLVVVAHLLGGFAVLVGLAWIALGHLWPRDRRGRPPWLRRAVVVAIGVLVVQIALGGWTSSNYAALACTQFPTCQGQWWPETDFAAAFVPWRGLGINYEGGVLDGPARTAIHMAHRIGAIVTALVVGGLALACLWPGRPAAVRAIGGAIAALLTLQVGLGIANVVWLLPLPVATAHNGMAALLLLALVLALHRLKRGPSDDR